METIDTVNKVEEAVEAVVKSTTISSPSFLERNIGNSKFTVKEGLVGAGVLGAGAAVAETVRFVIRKKPITRAKNTVKEFFEFRKSKKDGKTDKTPKGEINLTTDQEKPEEPAKEN